MDLLTPTKKRDLYNSDFLAWVEETVGFLRSHQWQDLDIENLIEEIADLGKSQQHALQSSLRLILMHLLKWKYQSERQSHSWKITINRERLNIDEYLEASPSLRRLLSDSEWINKTYQRARREAMVETNLALATFPVSCPFNILEILDLDFYPQPD
ncbi:DUF29 domain-containing protein [Pseudanabaena mucicola]|uniref:DUF29 domain-containing protein n=1 Tax=Pseudanabaena mucicola FACHB-723 TaxID=2692860 RepID=A0ABR7ZYJ2_9CYAN|nr:DUF29 domain-containing protein [Pseudanabaena mucicola]MBD2188914.1 DUF29 domain-containing protein [Pseudanabaena mucicola FACHB-723]